MSKNITPVSGYTPYPISVPVAGDPFRASDVEAAFQDTINKIQYFKDDKEIKEEQLTVIENNVDAIEASQTSLEASVGILQTNVSTLDTQVGGVDFSGCSYISNGASHKTGLTNLDTELVSVDSRLDAIEALPYGLNISSIASKLSTTALDNNNGLGLVNAPYIISTDKTDTAISNVAFATQASRRQNNTMFEFHVLNMMTIYSVSTGIYDNFDTESKIYYAGSQPTSTPASYSSLKQEFGLDGQAWVLYTTQVTIPYTTNNVMLRMKGTGTITPYVTFGGYSGAYTQISSQNTWSAMTAGSTSLVVKFVGSAGSKLYCYILLYKG